MPPDPKDWYDPAPDYRILSQGDVLDNVPTVTMPPASKSWILLRPAPPVTIIGALAGATPKAFRPRTEADAADAWAHGEELVLARGTRRRLMVVNHNCDIDNRNFYQLARVYDAAEMSTKTDSLQKNEITYAFFLPAAQPHMPVDQFADLSQIAAVHKSYVRDAVLVQRLSNRAVHELQRHLVAFYGRPFGFSVDDQVSEPGNYACTNCFFTAGILEMRAMAAGSPFAPCSHCDTKATWVKTPTLSRKGAIKRALGWIPLPKWLRV